MNELLYQCTVGHHRQGYLDFAGIPFSVKKLYILGLLIVALRQSQLPSCVIMSASVPRCKLGLNAKHCMSLVRDQQFWLPFLLVGRCPTFTGLPSVYALVVEGYRDGHPPTVGEKPALFLQLKSES